MGQVQLALEDLPEGQPVRANLLDINKALRQSKDLDSQLLAFTCKQAIPPRVIELNDAVAGTLKMLQRIIREIICLAWRSAGNRPGRHVCSCPAMPRTRSSYCFPRTIAWDFYKKPFSAAELTEAVGKLVEVSRA